MADERRRQQVELNLLAEDDGSRSPLAKRGRGCGLPFAGGLLLLLAGEVLRAVLG